MTTPSGSELFLVDSSGWLEYITEDTKADLFAPYLEFEKTVLVPTIVLFEVRRILLQRQHKSLAELFVSQVFSRTLVSLDHHIALSAANFSIDHHLSMADALIYATADQYKAQLITSDSHFANLAGVTLI